MTTNHDLNMDAAAELTEAPAPKFTITPFDAHTGANGSGRATAKPHGFWSSNCLTLYVERKIDWDNYKDVAEQPAEWVFTMSLSHSSGGRDTKEVADDLQAENNFALAMLGLVEFANNIRAMGHIEVWEAEFQAERAARKAAEAAKKAEADARFDADPALGEARAKALVALAIAQVKANPLDLYGVNRLIVTIVALQRGRDKGANITVSASRTNTIQVRINNTGASAKEATKVLAGASVRSAINTHQGELEMCNIVFKGKNFKTVNGLLGALARDSRAVQVSMVGPDHMIRTYAADRVTVLATYAITPPKAGESQIVTRV